MMSPKKPGDKMLPKSVRLTKEEVELLRQISEAELISEAALMRKFVLEGLRRYRPDQAIKRYQEGELDLSSAAQVSGLPIREFMGELHRRGVDIYGPEHRLAEGIGALAEVFGGSEALRRSVRPK
jgi:predicted HTH domain antitoxin